MPEGLSEWRDVEASRIKVCHGAVVDEKELLSVHALLM